MLRWILVMTLGCATAPPAAASDPGAEYLDALLAQPLTPDTAVRVALLHAELDERTLSVLVRDVKIAFIEVQAAQGQCELDGWPAEVDAVVAREIFERRLGLWGSGKRWEIAAPLPDAPAEAAALPVLATRITTLGDEPLRAEVQAQYAVLLQAHLDARRLRAPRRTPAYVDALRRYWTALASLEFSLSRPQVG